jgi:cytochrome P450
MINFPIINYLHWQDIEEGKISTCPDLLSILLSTPDEEGHLATNEEIKDNMLTLLFAGHDTTNCTLTVILKYLFLNPHCLHEVIKGIVHFTRLFLGNNSLLKI